ncbi:MAG: hypothetical protein EOP49_17035 [Sphingobacteriales bacterium]|nr:MAG: hypothetical protein EOP49_17035 [Sphingobacteriales bacterium]
MPSKSSALRQYSRYSLWLYSKLCTGCRNKQTLSRGIRQQTSIILEPPSVPNSVKPFDHQAEQLIQLLNGNEKDLLGKSMKSI